MGEEEDLRRAEEELERGELIVMPTDTVYGVAARPDLPEATGKVFAAKRRSRGLALPVLAASVDDVSTVVILDDRARALADRFWPGALTLILTRSDRSSGWNLGDERRTVGVRVPDHQVALSLLLRTGPLAVTSANRSGEPTPPDCEGVRAVLRDAVAFYLCGGSLPGGAPSTVVDLTLPEVRVVRAGAVAAGELVKALRS